MINSDRRQCLRGLEDPIFDLVCLSATARQWAEWLQTPLQHAAAAGDRNLTLKLLAAGARGNALIAAARGGHDTLVDDLLQAGVRPADEKDDMTGGHPLHIAAALGHSGIVSSLSRETDTDEVDSQGRTPLHLAAEGGHLSTVQALLAAGAGVGAQRADDDQTALALACRGGHLGTVTVLLHHGADVRARSARSDYTALHEAAINNRPHCITALVDAGADIESEGGWYSSKCTPLYCAAEAGCTEAVITLLRHGALKEASKSFSGNNPLRPAIRGQHVRVVEALLSAGVDVNLSKSLKSGYLNMAAGVGNVEILRSIVKHGADVLAVHFKNRQTPLHTAAYNKQVGTIHVLVEAGADINAQDDKGTTPLHQAALHGCHEGVIALLGYGADKDKTDGKGRTPLHLAAKAGLWIAVEALLADGADVAVRRGGQRRSALDYAASRGFGATVELLVRHGADVHARDSRGDTALHWPARGLGADSIDTLVRLGAIVDVQNNEGVTPFDNATLKGNCRAASSLLKHGVNVNARTVDGDCALHCAVRSCELENIGPMVALLLESDADETATNDYGLTPIEILNYTASSKVRAMMTPALSTLPGCPLALIECVTS